MQNKKEIWVEVEQEFFFLWSEQRSPQNALSTKIFQNEQKDKPLGLKIAQYFPFASGIKELPPLPFPISQKIIQIPR